MSLIKVPQQLRLLGITEEHLAQCRLPLTEEACTLVDAGLDVFERALQMTPETYDAWRAMEHAAKLDAIELQVVSAFRSVDYQCELITRKLTQGQRIDDILCVNAIPGYSEHHTGKALDLTTPDCPPLEIAFEQTDAFRWLERHASEFSFYLSYPRDNTAGIDYEPWHWAFVEV